PSLVQLRIAVLMTMLVTHDPNRSSAVANSRSARGFDLMPQTVSPWRPCDHDYKALAEQSDNNSSNAVQPRPLSREFHRRMGAGTLGREVNPPSSRQRRLP